MQTDQHIWRTDDGRHVPDGHPDAALLAYAAGDPVPDEVLDELKARRKPADKAKAQPADKTGSGLTITKLDDQSGDKDTASTEGSGDSKDQDTDTRSKGSGEE